jgi:hypothetical protein
VENFHETLTAAVKDIASHGFDSQQRVDKWIESIKQAAHDSLIPEHALQFELSKFLTGIYTKMIVRGGILRYHKGMARFTVERLSPRLRSELDRRIMASAQLIKLNRDQMIMQTVQRFSGWASSIPVGGSRAVDMMAVKANIKKSFSAQPYEVRRTLIDQSHKLVSSLNEIIAVDGGAIAGEWHSHFRQSGYNARVKHKERDGKYYAIRGNWAIDKGLMNKGAGYTDEMTAPGEEIFCRCSIRFIYALRNLPSDMLTVKGANALAETRIN